MIFYNVVSPFYPNVNQPDWTESEYLRLKLIHEKYPSVVEQIIALNSESPDSKIAAVAVQLDNIIDELRDIHGDSIDRRVSNHITPITSKRKQSELATSAKEYDNSVRLLTDQKNAILRLTKGAQLTYQQFTGMQGPNRVLFNKVLAKPKNKRPPTTHGNAAGGMPLGK